MHVKGTLSFFKTADGAEAHLLSNGSKWIAKYTTIEDALTAALLANAVNRHQANEILASVTNRLPMELEIVVNEFVLVRCGFRTTDLKQA